MIVLFALLSALTSGAAFYFWQQRRDLCSVLNEGAKGYEELSQKNKHLGKRNLNLEAEITDLKSRVEIHRQSVVKLQAQAAKDQLDYDLQLKSFERKLHDTENQRDHILKSFESKTEIASLNSSQLEALQARILDLESQNRILEQDLKAAQIVANAQAKSKISEFSALNQNLEKELRLYKSYIGPNPRDFDTVKRKANQFEKLYYGIKGLRDMADERSKNWEAALKELSTWILSSSPVARPNDPVLSQGIGPIVGEALSRIGATLVHEDVLLAEKQALKEMDQIPLEIESIDLENRIETPHG